MYKTLNKDSHHNLLLQIKLIDLKSATSKTLVGPAALEGIIQCQLHEPGGLCVVGNNKVYIADTNNHGIKMLHLDSRSIERVSLYSV